MAQSKHWIQSGDSTTNISKYPLISIFITNQPTCHLLLNYQTLHFVVVPFIVVEGVVGVFISGVVGVFAFGVVVNLEAVVTKVNT